MKKYNLKNIDCANCAAKIESDLSKMEEVKFVSVNFANSSITIDTENLDLVKSKIDEIEPGASIEEIKSNVISKSELMESRNEIIKILLVAMLLSIGFLFSDFLENTPYQIGRYIIFITAYLISGYKVLLQALKNITKGRVFDENFLMSIATLGAIAINELPEAVAVMFFYVVGEFFQDISVNRSRRSIKSLLEIKPEFANVIKDGTSSKVSPEEVLIGDLLLVKPGEKIPLDGEIVEGETFVDTAALTGESKPVKVKVKEAVLAGMINQTNLIKVRVTRSFNESSISKILDLVENAANKKANTEKFITKFAGYYTPFVVFSSLLIAVLPPLLFTSQTFEEWIYRALVVLVISCPCALVISIPLGYFGGVGGASRKGILVKGSNYLDALTEIKAVVFDKTGTLTKGKFSVSQIKTVNGFSEDQLLEYAAYAEKNSNHPIAEAIKTKYNKSIDELRIKSFEDISGFGIKAIIDEDEILVGNDKLLHKEKIEHTDCEFNATVANIVVNKKLAGFILITDSLKDDSKEAIKNLHESKISTYMLTGDNHSTASFIANELGIDKYYTELLPEEKVDHLENIIADFNQKGKVAFVGDGINDSPVLARADVGIAMGALGSQAAIETADVVLMNDSPNKVFEAIEVSKKTRRIVWQNIIFALTVKGVFIILGTIGIAGMWEAVFGDMGVAIIAILNATRVLK
ncbi:MAG: cadmium-translocating P-type ATPase [Melioribacteraceae bacterium]|nr:cadmium-translocating P-type ATPase [Melioribacteraceae bacterium]